MDNRVWSMDKMWFVSLSGQYFIGVKQVGSTRSIEST